MERWKKFSRNTLESMKVVYRSGSDTPDKNRAVESTVRAISGGA